MRIVERIKELRDALAGSRRTAFVPTMGNLHEGHLSLVRMAKENGEPVVASIFVNRLQFAPGEDFGRYPRTFERDCDALRAEGCDLVFAPDERELYPQAQTFRVSTPPGLGDVLEGAFRPGFFEGVCTVVLKLFGCVQPAVAVFGSKDYQQLRVVQHLVCDLAMPVEVLAAPTARADDGLALSSRNRYLDDAQRELAPEIHRTLQFMCGRAGAGDPVERIEADARQRLSGFGFEVDYAALRSVDLQRADRRQPEWVALIAARLGSTRLIDNLRFALGVGEESLVHESSSPL